jgi:hypothetical protein
MSGPLEQVDLPALGTDFAIPIFILQGQKDLTALPELPKASLFRQHQRAAQAVLFGAWNWPCTISHRTGYDAESTP